MHFFLNMQTSTENLKFNKLMMPAPEFFFVKHVMQIYHKNKFLISKERCHSYMYYIIAAPWKIYVKTDKSVL